MKQKKTEKKPYYTNKATLAVYLVLRALVMVGPLGFP